MHNRSYAQCTLQKVPYPLATFYTVINNAWRLSHVIRDLVKLSYKSTIIEIKCHGSLPCFLFPRDLERDLPGQQGLGHFASVGRPK